MYLCWWTVCPRGYLSFGTTSFMSSTTHNTTILADASPSIIRRHSSESIRDTDSRSSLGVPRIVLRDIKDMSYVQSTDSQFWYKNNSSFNVLKQCHVSLTDIFADSDPMSSISKCSAKNCKLQPVTF